MDGRFNDYDVGGRKNQRDDEISFCNLRIEGLRICNVERDGREFLRPEASFFVLSRVREAGHVSVK